MVSRSWLYSPHSGYLRKAQKENPYSLAVFTCWHKWFWNFSPHPCSNCFQSVYGEIIESVTALFTHTSIKNNVLFAGILSREAKSLLKTKGVKKLSFWVISSRARTISPRRYQHESGSAFSVYIPSILISFFVALPPPCFCTTMKHTFLKENVLGYFLIFLFAIIYCLPYLPGFL